MLQEPLRDRTPPGKSPSQRFLIGEIRDLPLFFSNKEDRVQWREIKMNKTNNNGSKINLQPFYPMIIDQIS